MTGHLHVLLSCAMSVDGCLDAPGPSRLVLSGPADLDRVDAERAASDAIMVGAGTIRRDDPRLLVRSPARQAARVARGQPGQPARVTLTASGQLSPRAQLFTAGPEPLLSSRHLAAFWDCCSASPRPSSRDALSFRPPRSSG